MKDGSAFAAARLVASLFVLDPVGFGGVALRGRYGPIRDGWIAAVRGALDNDMPWRRWPASVDAERLQGGLDHAATLAAGRPVRSPGLLAACDGGVVELAMAERLEGGVAAILAAAMDRDEEGPAFALLACDEGIDDEEMSRGLSDRLGFYLDIDAIDPHTFDANDLLLPTIGKGSQTVRRRNHR